MLSSARKRLRPRNRWTRTVAADIPKSRPTSGPVNPSSSCSSTAARWFGESRASAARISWTSNGSIPGLGSGDRGGWRFSRWSSRLAKPERRSVDPRERIADPVPVLDRAGERLGDRVLGQLPPPAGEPVDRSPQLRPGVAEQRLQVVPAAPTAPPRRTPPPRPRVPLHVAHSRLPSPSRAYRARGDPERLPLGLTSRRAPAP